MALRRNTRPRPKPKLRQLLGQSDFTYLGSYPLNLSVMGLDNPYCRGLTHRYVGGQIRFLILGYTMGSDVFEFALPAGGFGTTITATTNRWTGSSCWPAGLGAPYHHGLWYEDRGGSNDLIWHTYGADYTSTFDSLGISNVHLGDGGGTDVSNQSGPWGFDGVSQRCVMGGVRKNPTWFQSQYGLGAYLYGFGGYSSLMAQASTASLGLFLLAGPDITPYTPSVAVPTTDFKIVADHRSGATHSTDWYTSPGSPTTFDRGRRVSLVKNYYDSGGQSSDLAGTATFTNGSDTVTFSQSQNLAAGNWIGPNSGSALIGRASEVLVADVVNSTTATVTGAYTGTTTTGTCKYFTNPPADPTAGANWNGVSPDGYSRWEWGVSYFATGNWIDGTSKYGFVAVMSGASGKAWYHAPGNFLSSDAGAAEIHVFDPADFGAVAAGSKNSWNVQPVTLKDITNDLTPLGICTNGHGNESNGPSGATYDPTTKRLWVLCTGVNNGYVNQLVCYGVNA